MKYYRYKKRRSNFSEKIGNLSVVAWLIIINIIAFVIGSILLRVSEDSIDYIALQPNNILHGDFLWTLVTHMFMHAPGTFALHLIVNMFVLYSLGGLIEKIIGRKRFLWFYIIAGLFAGILSVLLAGFFGHTDLGARIFGSPEVFMVGASGAIFAIAGLYVVLLPRVRFMIIFLPFFSLPAYIMVPLVLIGMWLASIAGGLPVGNVAHFGGFLAGIFYGFYLRSKYRKKVARLQRMFR